MQEAYVAFYGRPADPAGQAYWAGRMDAAGGSLDAIIAAFGTSDEFYRRYGGLSYQALVTKIYQQTLGRNPDQGGLDWYVGELVAGRRSLQSITLDVLNGATTAPDATVVAHKLDVAAYYTARVAAGCPYGTEQEGVNILSGVSAYSATVTAAGAAIDARCGPAAWQVQMTWITVPTQPVTPGTLVDPDPLSIQDGGLNSSLVLRIMRNGQPVSGEEVAWSSTDATSNIQTSSTRSDRDGLVRAWYLAGAGSAPRVTGTHILSGATTAVTLQRVATASPTVGRYVAAWYSAPAGTYSATTISVIPRTAPKRTYYQLTSYSWTNFMTALYGGLQMTDCDDLGSTPHPGIAASCFPARGAYAGRLALFSSWDWVTPEGATLKPVAVNVPPTSRCQPFDHELTGMQCVAPLDWGAGEEWRWTVEALPGAAAGFQRVRVTASNAARKLTQEIATIDIGGVLRMQDFNMFNENWGGQPAASCLAVELRSMTIASVGFWNGQAWAKPSHGLAMGGLYNDSMPRCENYGFGVDTGGLTIASGGTGLWVRLTDTLLPEPGTGRMIFPSKDQVDSQWQALDLSTIAGPPGGH